MNNTSKSTILLVDDTLINLDILFAQLSHAGFKVFVAQDGAGAIAQADYVQPDLILLDVMMPGIDGFETCRRLKEKPSAQHIPIIFMSALTDAESKVKGFEVGGVDYVTKPIEWREMLARIQTHLIIRTLQEQLKEENWRLRESEMALRKSKQALRKSEERYALAARATNDGLWDWDFEQNRIYFSPRWKKMLGYHDYEIEAEVDEWFDRVHSEDLSKLKKELDAHLAGQLPHIQSEYRILHRYGRYRWMYCRGLAVRNEKGQVTRIVGSQTDITSRKRVEEQLRYDSSHDSLTKLPNRILFLERLEKLLTRTQRNDQYTFAIFFIDLDQFKMINDHLGHLVGDELLVRIARRLEACIRAQDTVARFGGDEFAMLLDGMRQVDHATQLAERIQSQLVKPIQLDGHKLMITASMGITFSSYGYKRAEDMIRDADTAMYRAKIEGPAGYMVFEQG